MTIIRCLFSIPDHKPRVRRWVMGEYSQTYGVVFVGVTSSAKGSNGNCTRTAWEPASMWSKDEAKHFKALLQAEIRPMIAGMAQVDNVGNVYA